MSIDDFCHVSVTERANFFLFCSYMGIDIKSQTAYDLASQGPIRPSHDSPPILYGIRCIDFQLPEFTIGIVDLHIDDNEFH